MHLIAHLFSILSQVKHSRQCKKRLISTPPPPRDDGTNFYLTCASCAQGFPNLCPLHWIPIRGKLLGAKEMLLPPSN